MGEIDLDEIERIFDESWDELVSELWDGKWIPMSEKDLQLYLAHKLINRLFKMGKADWVHIELQMPVDPSKIEYDIIYHGRVKKEKSKGKIKRPDITIANIGEFPPQIYLIAEVKYFTPYLLTSPAIRSFLKKMMEEKIDREALERFLRALKTDENQYMARADQYIDEILKDLDKISSLIRIYSEAWGIEILGCVCVIDEIYGGKLWDRISSIHEDKYSDVRLYYDSHDLYRELRALVKRRLS